MEMAKCSDKYVNGSPGLNELIILLKLSIMGPITMNSPESAFCMTGPQSGESTGMMVCLTEGQ